MSEKGADLLGFSVVKVTWSEAVNEVAVPGVGWDASSAGMGLCQVSVSFEACHLVSDRGGRHI